MAESRKCSSFLFSSISLIPINASLKVKPPKATLFVTAEEEANPAGETVFAALNDKAIPVPVPVSEFFLLHEAVIIIIIDSINFNIFLIIVVLNLCIYNQTFYEKLHCYFINNQINTLSFLNSLIIR